MVGLEQGPFLLMFRIPTGSEVGSCRTTVDWLSFTRKTKRRGGYNKEEMNIRTDDARIDERCDRNASLSVCF